MGITRIGNRKLRRAVDRWEKDIETQISYIIQETASIIVHEAKMLVPVDEGALRDSIEMKILGKFKAVVIVGQFYAVYVEYGTGIYAKNGNGRKTPWSYYYPKIDSWVWTEGMKPQPFWTPAIEIAEKYFKAEMRKLGR